MNVKFSIIFRVITNPWSLNHNYKSHIFKYPIQNANKNDLTLAGLENMESELLVKKYNLGSKKYD